ncbi:MAG: N-acetylmuramoyl-L-alanine amidase [Bacteroidaceae bacterium]|nr:N-acetylmuramoyl-L-alanine amidase [Bacteroidaceae bacterium]
MRAINEIIVHCSATPEGKDFTVADITRWHKARKFRTIGYHYVIYRDGSIHAGRPLEETGAHCVGHNRHSIGICYIGGCATDGKTPKDTRTPEQREALAKLLAELHRRFPHASLHGHREFAAKACPSFNVKEYKHLFLSMILACACLFFSACRTTQWTLEEKVDSTRLETASTSTTSLATDKFIQNLVLNIDSIVLTSLSVSQVPEGDNEASVIDHTSDISDRFPCSGIALTSSSLPRNRATIPLGRNTKVVVHGLRLESNTADSSSVKTEVTNDNTLHSSYHSKAKAKEKKVPSIRWPLSLIAIAAIVIAAIAWLIRKWMVSS